MGTNHVPSGSQLPNAVFGDEARATDETSGDEKMPDPAALGEQFSSQRISPLPAIGKGQQKALAVKNAIVTTLDRDRLGAECSIDRRKMLFKIARFQLVNIGIGSGETAPVRFGFIHHVVKQNRDGWHSVASLWPRVSTPNSDLARAAPRSAKTALERPVPRFGRHRCRGVELGAYPNCQKPRAAG